MNKRLRVISKCLSLDYFRIADDSDSKTFLFVTFGLLRWFVPWGEADRTAADMGFLQGSSDVLCDPIRAQWP